MLRPFGIVGRVIFINSWNWLFMVVYFGWYVPVLHFTYKWGEHEYLLYLLMLMYIGYTLGYFARNLARKYEVEVIRSVKGSSKASSGSS